ncbi:hypothetical protein ENSA5_10360 [Enhygromyxa salina]|uniref:Uncharacterized protein n=1 Tax=Enhygromyxa salina TaxID=215803 RepID=A0A2S9YGL1_9BACT|nr:hypothetical protein [Enhygromyxa salina]PRQ04146.1 hypothetical protein ENSA5_10360 [Enhygromyxa salina]
MRGLKATLLGLALACALGSALSCGAAGDQVELRLFPCEFEGIEPRAVVVEITGFDADGAVVESFEVGFDDIAAAVFDDGYATVGYRSDAAVVTARVRVGWFSRPESGTIAEAEAVAVYESQTVPAHGQVLSLGATAGDCAELAGDGDGDTGDGDTGDGDGDTGDGDGDTGDGDGDTGDGDGDGDTGDGDGDTGDGDGDTGDGDGDTGDGDGDTGDGDGDPIDLPMIGDPCDGLFAFQCVPELNGDAGTALRCQNDELTATDNFAFACDGLCPDNVGTPVEACAGLGTPAQCLCEPPVAEGCDQVTLGCTGDGHIKLCFNGVVVIGTCNNCSMMGGYYTCSR